MSATPATADWELLETKYYRKVLLYAGVFPSSIELNAFHITGAPYSGALALYRDPDAISTVYTPASAAVKPVIRILSVAGNEITSVAVDKITVVAVGWSAEEQLIVITEDGSVRVYNDFQGGFEQFGLGHGAEDVGVRDARFWNCGFVARLKNNRLLAVQGYHEPRPRMLADPTPLLHQQTNEDGVGRGVSDEAISSWALIPPQYTLSRHVEVLLSTGTTILVVDASEAQDQVLQNGPFSHIAVSPNGRYVALYTTEGKLWVIKSDFQEKLSEYDSGMGNIMLARDIAWCGNDSVVLAWDEEVHMVGPHGAALRWYYDTRVHLVPDIDSVKIITNEKAELIQKVPDGTEDIFRIGATSPAAVLVDAVDQLEKGSPKVEEAVAMIKRQMPEAVDACIRAAGEEYSVHWQKQLLRAASFGKSTIEAGYDSDGFVEMCETIRVLNAVRFFEVGLPVTYEQFLRLTPEKLLLRLVNRQKHLLALRISEYMRLPTDKIYIHWACMKVRLSSEPEDSICRLIVGKLNGQRGISYEEIARTAYDEGRRRLATELLNYEPIAGKQVPLLLSMGQDEIALDKAIESGDTDLVYYVLLHLKKNLPLHSFFRMVNVRPVAAALIETTAFDTDRELLKDFYYQDDRRAESALIIFRESLEAPDLQQTLEKLKISSNLLSDAKLLLPLSQTIDDSAKLLSLQETISRDIPSLAPSIMGASLNTTIFTLLRHSHTSRAEKLRSQFKVPEKRWWMLRLRALVARREWAEIEDWAAKTGKKGKSPIGWEPFVREILAAGNARLAAMLVERIVDREGGYQRRVEWWVKCGAVVKAAEEAAKYKDLVLVENVKRRAPEHERGEIERMLEERRK